MRYLLPDGRYVYDGQAFYLSDVAYPGNWLSLASAEDRAAKGISEAPETVTETLEQLTTRLLYQVDVEAEAERRKYITDGAGQALTYREKAAEAARFVAMNGSGEYPFLDAMIGAGRATTRAQAAQIVSAAEAQWTQIGAAIELRRERAKLQIAAAQTVEAKLAAARVEWP